MAVAGEGVTVGILPIGSANDFIKKYVEEKEIIRPLDMVVKSVVNKSGIKVYIIQSIDMKRPLEDIAEAKGLEMGNL